MRSGRVVSASFAKDVKDQGGNILAHMEFEQRVRNSKKVSGRWSVPLRHGQPLLPLITLTNPKYLK